VKIDEIVKVLRGNSDYFNRSSASMEKNLRIIPFFDSCYWFGAGKRD